LLPWLGKTLAILNPIGRTVWQGVVAELVLGFGGFGVGVSLRYLIGDWQSFANEMAGILRETSVGGPGQPAYGCYTAELGAIYRPKFSGAQMFIWDIVNSYGVTGFSWLREAINDYFGLPEDDTDFILSTVETTATFAQFWRVFGYHKHGWLLGSQSTIPGA
jgi:hypothetical protein